MESHIEVDDDLDIEESRQEIKRQLAQTDEKKKRKYFRKLFEFLGGGDSPIEALELALGRDKLLQVKQMNYMSIFSLWIDESNSDFVHILHEKRKLLELLSNCCAGKCVIRLILINPKNCNGKVTGHKHLYYHCLNMLQYITDERYIENRPEQVKNVKIAVEHNAVPRLVDFLDPTFGNPLTMFHAANALKNFISVSDEASIQIYKAGGLKKCLHLMSRRECHKMYMDYYKETFLGNSDVDKDEEEIMRKFYTGKITFFKRIERYPMLTEYDHRKECLMYMASQTQENCALVTYKLAATNKFERREILLSKSFCKVLNRWFHTPCIWRTERAMLQYCFNILRGAIEDSQPFITAKDVMKNYNVMELIEEHIYNPDKEVLIGVVNLLGVVARQYPKCWKLIAENEIFPKAVAIYINSYDDQVQIGALQTICTLAQVPSSSGLVLDIGITAEKMHLLTKYDIDQVTEVFKQVRIFLSKNCPLKWKASERMFQKVNVEKKFSFVKAQKYKEEGNKKYKEEKFEAALKCYTLGLECVPPVEGFGKPSEQKKTNWFVLPSALYTNRAQCHLTMKNWREAIVDCTQAVIRSFEDNDEARAILQKTVFRRARAFLEIHDYRNALTDISFCLRRNVAATNLRSLFREILTKYRKRYGIEPMRRCGACMDGVGTKLKRCAKCPEVYCSRACQAYAWDEGHKNCCNYTLDEKNENDYE